MKNENILVLKDVSVDFSIKHRTESGKIERKTLSALHDVNLELRRNEILGLVGESGCGKSTLARTVIGLQKAFTGKIEHEGNEIVKDSDRRDIQMVFQDPYSCLNPRIKVDKTLEEVLDVRGVKDKKTKKGKIDDMLFACGLPLEVKGKYPRELSGGQCQRIGIARALLASPKILIADEAVSALDVSVQAQIVNMLRRLNKEINLSTIFISHDLAIVKYISDRIAVMYLGEIVEVADTETLFSNTGHPYTELLLSSSPGNEKNQDLLTPEISEIPSAIDLSDGCRFYSRCPYATERCSAETPELREIEPGHLVSCFIGGEFSEKKGTGQDN